MSLEELLDRLKREIPSCRIEGMAIVCEVTPHELVKAMSVIREELLKPTHVSLLLERQRPKIILRLKERVIAHQFEGDVTVDLEDGSVTARGEISVYVPHITLSKDVEVGGSLRDAEDIARRFLSIVEETKKKLEAKLEAILD